MSAAADSAAPYISAVGLQLAASVLGLVGTALVILQAQLWIPAIRANPAVLVLTALAPLIAVVFFALMPRRVEQDSGHDHPLKAPVVWITLGLPLLLTLLVVVLVGINGNFNNFAGFALLLAANTGRNLRDFVSSLLLRIAGRKPR